MPVCRITLNCPPMPIYKADRTHKRTGAENMTAELIFDDGSQVIITPVTIPETPVDRLSLLHWQVAACVGSGMQNGNQLIVNLPPEPVVFELEAMTMVALSIECQTTLTLADGSTWQGMVVFPDCPTDIMSNPMIAASVVALGSLTRVEPPTPAL